MPIVRLIPSSVVLNGDDEYIGVGADGPVGPVNTGNISDFVTDAEDSTAAILFNSSPPIGQRDLIMGVTGQLIQEDQVVRRMRVVMVAGFPIGPHYAFIRQTTTQAASRLVTAVEGGLLPRKFMGPWVSKTPDGGAIDQAAIDDLQIKITAGKELFAPADAVSFGVSAAWIELDVLDKPVPYIYAPTEDELQNPGLEVHWTAPEGNVVQRSYECKIFLAADVEFGGFNPSTDIPVVTSGVRKNPWSMHSFYSPNKTEGPLLFGTEYYAYVRQSIDNKGVDYWSGWAGQKFTTFARPVIAFSLPDDPAPTTKPRVTYTYDGDIGFGITDQQGVTAVRLFTPDVYGVLGFLPGSPKVKAIWEVTYGWPTFPKPDVIPTTFVIGKILNNGDTYRVYLRAYSKEYGSPSLWTYAQFTVDITPPDQPTFTVTPNDALNRMEIEAEIVDPSDPGWVSQTLLIERSNDGGDTWETVVEGGTTYSGNDYEAAIGGKPILYRAFNVGVFDPGAVIVHSDPVEVTVALNVFKVWFRDPRDETNSRHFISESDWLTADTLNNRAAFLALGASKPKTRTGEGDYQTLGLAILLLSEDDKKDFMRFVMGDTFLLMSPKLNRWVQCMGNPTVSEYLWDGLRGEQEWVYRATADLIEVDRWVAPVEADEDA